MSKVFLFFTAILGLASAFPVEAGTHNERALERWTRMAGLRHAKPPAPGGDPAWLGPSGTATAPTTGNWSPTGSNWSPSGVPASGAALSFGGSGSTSYTSTDNISSFTLSTVSLTSTANVTDIIAGNTLTIDGNPSISQDNTGAFTIQNNMSNGSGTTLTLTGNGTGLVTLTGIISEFNSGSKNVKLTKTGTSTFVLSGANTFTGATTISGGTLKIDNNNTTTARLAGTTNITINSGGTLLLAQSGGTSSNDRINNSATMKLNGGTFNTGGLSEHGASSNTAGIGALTLQTTSIIDMGSGASIVAFANSSGATWSGTLKIYDWSGTPKTGGGTDQLYFGNDATGLTSTQLGEIQFYSDAGITLYGGSVTILSNGEVVPVPEPSTWFGGALAFSAIGFTQRRRLGKLLRVVG